MEESNKTIFDELDFADKSFSSTAYSYPGNTKNSLS